MTQSLPYFDTVQAAVAELIKDLTQEQQRRAGFHSKRSPVYPPGNHPPKMGYRVRIFVDDIVKEAEAGNV